MTVRRAKRTLTGCTVDSPAEVVLGVHRDGRRGVTLHAEYRESWPFDNPALLDALADDLRAAAAYLRGVDL